MESSQKISIDDATLENLRVVYADVSRDLAEYRSFAFKISFYFGTIVIGMLAISISRDTPYTHIQFACLILGLTSLLTFSRGYLSRIENYYLELAEFMHKAEVAFGMFEENRVFAPDFSRQASSFMPAAWYKFGTPEWSDPIFQYTRRMLYASYALAIVVLALLTYERQVQTLVENQFI